MKKGFKKRKWLTCFRSIFLITQIILLLSVLYPAPVNAAGGSQQTKRITGTVTEENGKPLPGATILVEGTTTGALTDSNGKYSLETVKENPVLLFSFIGYKPQSVPFKGKMVIDISMVPDFQALDEIVVVGYGTQKKVNLSGAVDVVTSKSIDSRPIANVSQALQGVAPNLNISVGNTGGEMGAKFDLNIRGLGSISGGSVYTLVDGIEQDISRLNPDDIESISVLKDAAASAIYGARAAFGVILVTTKKGRTDGISINYNNNFSFASPTIVPHSVNSLVFSDYFDIASINDGQPAMFDPTIKNNIKRYLHGDIDFWTTPNIFAPSIWFAYSGAWGNTDWYKEHYRNWTPNSTHNLSISGGDKKTQFHISGSVFDQQGLLKIGDDNFNRYNLNSKINTSAYDWLKINLITKFNKTVISRPSYDKSQYYNEIARQWPTNAPYYPDGNIANENAQLWMEQGGRYNESQNELTFIPGLELEPIKGWMIYVNYRWKMNFAPVTNHNAKVYGTLTDGSKIAMRTVNSFESYRYDSFYNSPNIYSNYTKNFGNHTFTVMMGFEQELIKYGSNYGKRFDLVSDDVPSLTTATGRQEVTGEGVATSSIGQWATRSFFGRLNYNFKEKYLLEFSFRRDGSSKFPDGYRWGMFPSGSAAYVISKESFWKPLSQFIPMMKLRASYGSLGNQDVANYLYIERLPINSKLPYIMGDNLPVYIGMPGLISQGLTWEKVNTSNIGLDAGLMKSRLNLSFDYFIRNTSDMLGPSESLPAVLGTKVPKRNNATLKSQGFEFVIEWKDFIGEASYNIKFMISDVTSKVTDYYNPSRLLVKDGYYKGAKIGDIWGFTTTGLFKSDDDAQAADQSYLSAEPWRAGDVEYTDINNDGKIDIGNNTVDNPGDLSIIGNSTPRFSYSFLTGGTWRSFDFNMLWQGVAKRDLALDGSLFWGATGGQWFSTCLREHQDYWTPENTDAYWPRPYLNKGNKNHYPQTRYLQNGAYLRLKSVQIGYTLPSKLTKKAFIQNLRIYLSGENLLTFTKLMKTFDPEATGGVTGSGQMYPLQKLVSTGISITF